MILTCGGEVHRQNTNKNTQRYSIAITKNEEEVRGWV